MFPYLTGVMMGARGVANTLAPFCAAMTVAMIVSWFFVPDPVVIKKSVEEHNSNDIELATMPDEHNARYRLNTTGSIHS